MKPYLVPLAFLFLIFPVIVAVAVAIGHLPEWLVLASLTPFLCLLAYNIWKRKNG